MSSGADLLGRLKGLRRSSTLRLSLLLSALFALGMAAAIFAALDYGRDAVLRRVDTALTALAASTELEDVNRGNAAVIVRALDDLDDLPPAFRRATERGRRTIELDSDYRRSDTWRVLVLPDSDGVPMMVALPLEDSLEALELLAGILWATVALVVLATLTIGLGTGLLAQRRVAKINDTLTRLAQGDLSARTARQRSADDLDDIAQRLDRTAAELERLVAQTRNLSASLAHDLRTPLARLRAQLEMLPDSDERAVALEEAGRLSDIFDTIMRVARIEAAQGDEGFELVDLGALVEELAEIFGPVVEDSGKSLRVETSGSAQVSADRQMLVQAMANLIQNALVYGGDQVTLFAQADTLGVADNGPGVDPAMYDEIIKPLVRLDAARRSDGSGLGLALVRAVADRHGATLTLAAHQPSGLRVTLNFAKL